MEWCGWIPDIRASVSRSDYLPILSRPHVSRGLDERNLRITGPEIGPALSRSRTLFLDCVCSEFGRHRSAKRTAGATFCLRRESDLRRRTVFSKSKETELSTGCLRLLVTTLIMGSASAQTVITSLESHPPLSFELVADASGSPISFELPIAAISPPGDATKLFVVERGLPSTAKPSQITYGALYRYGARQSLSSLLRLQHRR